MLMPGCNSRKCLKSSPSEAAEPMTSGTPPPCAKPCSSGMFPPREGDDRRIPALGDDDAEDCFAASCRMKASGISFCESACAMMWSEGYVRLITGSRLSKSYQIQWLIGTTPPGSQIPMLMNLPS